jgi:glycosyltransferase involved in cell wall biosynthesis
MHIGFDISQTGSTKAGCGYFAHAMIEAMLRAAPQHRYSLYPSFGDFYLDVNMPASNPYAGTHVQYGPRQPSVDAAREFWNRPDLEAALGFPDIVHANNFWCPTQLAASRLVYTLYDLSFVREPAWTTQANYAACWEGVSRAAVHADMIVAISDATRRHYLEVFPAVPPERIRVVYPPSRFAATSAAGQRPASAARLVEGNYWLSVGTIEPRKNQEGIAEAYARYLDAGGTAIPLVFAGGYGWLMEGFHRKLEALGVLPNVVMTGYVSDAELAWLYGHCRANLYLSHFEGFGLPVLEGMQFGAPTITSDASAMPEVAGNAAILVPPGDVERIARAMLLLDRSPAERSRLATLARERAAAFSADASAGSLMSLYGEVAAAGKRAPRG